MYSFYDSEFKENKEIEEPLFKYNYEGLNAYDISLSSNTYTFVYTNMRILQSYVYRNPSKLHYMIEDLVA